MRRIGHVEQRLGAADQPEVFKLGREQDLVQAGDILAKEIGQGPLGVEHADKGMQVGAAQVGIDQDTAFTTPGERDRNTGGNGGLPDPPLATADSPDPGLTVRLCGSCMIRHGRLPAEIDKPVSRQMRWPKKQIRCSRQSATFPLSSNFK